MVHSKALSDEELIDYALRVPGMVLINRDIPSLRGRCIALNNRQGAATATRHLLDLGHRHIAFLSSDHAIEDATLRLQGYQDALAEAGLFADPELVESGMPNEEGGERAMLNLLAKGQPITAVVAYNDAMAAGAISVRQLYGDDAYKTAHDALITLRGDATPETLARLAADLGHDADAIAEQIDASTEEAARSASRSLARH